jgi:hypothetical protein
MRASQLAVLSLIALAGCSSQETTERIDNVARVFWHERFRYSVMLLADGGAFQMRGLPDSPCDWAQGNLAQPRFYFDAPRDRPMWVEMRIREATWYEPECFRQLDFHLWSPDAVEGAEWDHGKSGRGRTSVAR